MEKSKNYIANIAEESTDTASNFSAEQSSSDMIANPLTPPRAKKRKFTTPRYIGDCHTSDMSSPSKAKINWALAKKSVAKQRKRLTFLQHQNRRLRHKITSLSSLLKHLKENQYISSSAEAVIEVQISIFYIQYSTNYLK